MYGSVETNEAQWRNTKPRSVIGEEAASEEMVCMLCRTQRDPTLEMSLANKMKEKNRSGVASRRVS